MGRGKGARKRERGRGRGDEGCGHKKKRAKTIRSTLELRRCALSQPAPSLQRRPAPAAMKSPDGQFFVEVLVAGEPQREYVHGNRTYVVRVQRPAPPPASLSLLSPASATMSVRRRADDGAPPPTPRAQESRLDTPATKMVDLVRPAPSPAPTRAWPCG